ncbi:MAG TPA: hypothetical protein VJC06_02175 [Candidatus Paceibacterota bacterium]
MDAFTDFLKTITEVVGDLKESEDWLDEFPRLRNLRIEVIEKEKHLTLEQLQRVTILLKLVDDVIRDRLNIERVERIKLQDRRDSEISK